MDVMMPEMDGIWKNIRKIPELNNVLIAFNG
jgi:CheY-like chemotaxis protein